MRGRWVYLYHFSDKVSGHAGHYLGSCFDLRKRDALHQSGKGARLLQVAKERGIKFYMVRTWVGGRTLERQLKNRKNAPLLCPVCHPPKRWTKYDNDAAQEVNFYQQ